MLSNIKCTVTELEGNDDVWHMVDKSVVMWSSLPINNMIQAKEYYKDNMQIETRCLRKLGNVVSRIIIEDFDSRYKNIYDFDYSGAYEV